MNLKLTKEIKSEIDYILAEIFENGAICYDSSTEARKKAFWISKSLNLIKQSPNYSKLYYELEEKGVIAIEEGGIENHLSNIKSEKSLDSTIRRLTKKRLEWEYLINIFFLLAGGFVTYLFTGLSENRDQKKFNTKIYQVKTELNDTLSNIKTRLDHQNTLIINLKKTTDSLKSDSLNK
ncbi:hypothetical protein [Lacinutrix sp. MEBiC02404]